MHTRGAHCYFLCVFSHDKQETDEVVQLQEGGKPLLITLTSALIYRRIIHGSVKVEATSSNQSLISGLLQKTFAVCLQRVSVFNLADWCVAGESVVTEEQTAVIAGVPQATFADNVQYQFRTENNGGQVRSPSASAAFCFPSVLYLCRNRQVDD